MHTDALSLQVRLRFRAGDDLAVEINDLVTTYIKQVGCCSAVAPLLLFNTLHIIRLFLLGSCSGFRSLLVRRAAESLHPYTAVLLCHFRNGSSKAFPSSLALIFHATALQLAFWFDRQQSKVMTRRRTRRRRITATVTKDSELY